MKVRKIKGIISGFLCSAIFMLSLAGCGETEIALTAGIANGKATTDGVIEYNNTYYIVDANGVNYKKSIDEKSVVVAHTSQANGTVQSNFAVGDDKIYFITTKKGQAKTLYQCELDGKKRKKLIVRDEINIVGVYRNSVYYYDEQNILKCINSETGLKSEFSSTSGAPFYQYNNCFIHKANDGMLEAYNCDSDSNILLSETPVGAFGVTDKGAVFAVNNSETENSYNYSFYGFDYNARIVKKINEVGASKPVDVITETVALTNSKNRLQVCDIKTGKSTDHSFKAEGKFIHNTGVSPNIYYINDNTCLKFSSESNEAQKIVIDYEKFDIDYNNVISIVNDQYIVSLDDEGYYSFDKIW